MKKTLFAISALSFVFFFPGCAPGRYSTVIVAQYDERCWFEDHWVYRFREGDHWVFRRWFTNRWEDERRESSVWETIKWERKARSDRDDGRVYENENNSAEKHEEINEGKNKNITK